MYLKNIRAKELSKHNTQTASGTHLLSKGIDILCVFQRPKPNVGEYIEDGFSGTHRLSKDIGILCVFHDLSQT